MFDTGPVALAEHRTEALAAAARQIRPVSLAAEHLLAPTPGLDGLLPRGGLVRGSTIVVGGPPVGAAGAPGAAPGATVVVPGATSLALALAAGPSRAGSWVAAVGVPGLGLAAAIEAGIAPERFAVIDTPPAEWAAVVAALVGAFDVVLVAPAHRVHPADARRLVARARERGSVVVSIVPSLPPPPRAGAAARSIDADLRVSVVGSRWQGVGQGHGHLEARRVVVEVTGRRGAARSRQVDLWLPVPAPGAPTSRPAPPETGTCRRDLGEDAGGHAGEDAGAAGDHELVRARRARARRAARAPVTVGGATHEEAG